MVSFKISQIAIIFATLLIVMPGATGQSTNATCLPFYEWAFNSHKQSPCQIASALFASCSGGSYNVDALSEGTHYLGPTLETANPCQCSTVSYSLMSACGACQGRTFITWSSWSSNCATVSINSYAEAIAADTPIPGWAYLDVKANDNFDETLARQNANSTESTAIISRSRSATTSASTHVTTPTLTSTAAASSTAISDRVATSRDKTRANAIGGGVVGGAIVMGIFTCWWINRYRRNIGSRMPLQTSAGDNFANMSEVLVDNDSDQKLSAGSSNMSMLPLAANAV